MYWRADRAHGGEGGVATPASKTAGEKREREEEWVGELHNLDAKLLGGELIDGKQWNGVTAAGSESSTRQRG